MTDPDIEQMHKRTLLAVSDILTQVTDYDEGRILFESLADRIRTIISHHVEATYDTAFMRGLEESATIDEESEIVEYEITEEDDPDDER